MDQFPKLKPEDLVISEWSGHHRGGWSVKPLSGIQIVHRPTGAMVQVDKDRSIHRNKATAMKMLEGKVAVIMEAKKQQETSQQYAQAALNDGLWPLIDAYADAREEYQRSTSRHLAKQQRQNMEDARAELSHALAAKPAEEKS